MVTVSIRNHCIPSYDFIRRVQKVSNLVGEQIPQELSSLEEETAGGICRKAIKIANSEFYKSLPYCQNIVSGGMSNYMFYRDKEKDLILSYLADLQLDV